MLCYAFCVGVRPAVALLRPTHSDAERTSRVVGPTQFTPPARHDTTVLSVSLLVCRCELDDCSERAQTLYFLSATVLSCRETDATQTIQFCRPLCHKAEQSGGVN